ncbi:MAG: acyltransferase [Alphaproteobacteria bacterium]|nr:acyltransferase [Alphaproteobacteria bacterium]
MSKTSVALNNLRAVVILIVVAFHSALAYLRFLGPDPFPFDSPPYLWRAFAIVDSRRWLGFDLFCAWQDVFLMSLMFFLSALFAWPSLTRKGRGKFLADRVQRLGVPYLFAVVVVMPLALYPTYRVTASDPSLAGYARHYLALPFWPAGPMWFLWVLLALTLVGVALQRFAPRLIALLGRGAASAADHPGRYFIGLVTVGAIAYVPLALAFTPGEWSAHGLFSFQLSRPLHYAVYYFAGFGIGVHGLERGLLAPAGLLARRWASWLAAALASLLVWMGLTDLAMGYPAGPPLGLQVAVALSFEIACASGCFFVIAACLRFAAVPSRLLGSVAARSFGMYLFHYIFVVWLQYALLGVALVAIAKGLIVFGGTVVLAWMTTAAMRFVPLGSRLLGPVAVAPRANPMPDILPVSGVRFVRPTPHIRELDRARSDTPCP